MSAQVEDRHREAADRWWEEQRIFEEMAGSLAQLLADTEAAERERSAALRAEFETCVRALRPLAATTCRTRLVSDPDSVFLWKPTSNIPGDKAEGISVADARRAEVALSGPLASEVKDACAADE